MIKGISKNGTLLLLVIFLAACSTPGGSEPAVLDGEGHDENQGDVTVEPSPEVVDNSANPDAATYAEDMGVSQEEADRRLAFQDTIGEIQPLLVADLADSFGGLWVEHQPEYRIVIALTQGDESIIKPYIASQAWAGEVEVVSVKYTLERLIADQETAIAAARQIKVPVSAAVDVINNRVEVWVGNPELFLDELTQNGLTLPESVVVTASLPGDELPDTNQGMVLEAMMTDGRTIYLPLQAPSNASMEALIESTLVEVDGCLRLVDEDYPDGFMVIWRHDHDLRAGDEAIEVLNGQGEVIGRVGERLVAGGGAFESPYAGEQLAETIPGLPVELCPGPFWILGEIKPLNEQ